MTLSQVLLGLWCLLGAGGAGACAQADTTLLVRFGDGPPQVLVGHTYLSPAGVRVHQHKVLLTRAQAVNFGLQLHTPQSDSINIKVMAVVGTRSYANQQSRISTTDFLPLGALTSQPLDCGSAQPCIPNRLVVDMRLVSEPNAHLWVCQIVLEDE